MIPAERATPFTCVLVPYDGSEPSRSALALALSIVPVPARFVIVTAVDESPVFGESAAALVAYDPTPLLEALDARGKAFLAEAVHRCAAAKVTPVTELVHDTPVSAIEEMIEKHGADLVVMGTHARTGVSRMFLGSTTESVLRSTKTPLLTVRSTPARGLHPFATALLGIDDSDASDAAVALTASFAPAFATTVVACNAIDMSPLYDNADAYPFDPQAILKDMRAEGNAVVARSLKRAGLDEAAVTVTIVEGKTAAVLLNAAQQCAATVIVMGSHGRRGLRRFFLGSVAEEVVRSSTLPVLIVREAAIVSQTG